MRVGQLEEDAPPRWRSDRRRESGVPLVVGADVTQLLSAKPGVLTRYVASQLEELASGIDRYNRHFKFLAARSFNLPGFNEQEAIVGVLPNMDAELAALEARRNETRQLKQGMMQALLTGRIRLV